MGALPSSDVRREPGLALADRGVAMLSPRRPRSQESAMLTNFHRCHLLRCPDGDAGWQSPALPDSSTF